MCVNFLCLNWCVITCTVFVFLVEFNLTDETKAAIVEAKQKFKTITDGLDMDYLQIHDKGKNYIKSNKLGPDSLMQFAIQVNLGFQERLLLRLRCHFASIAFSCTIHTKAMANVGKHQS